MSIATLLSLVMLVRGAPADTPKLTDSERALLQHAREELKSKTPARRVAAGDALGEVGPKMHDAVPELWLAMLDQNAKVRTAAGAALLKVDPEFGGAISSLALNSNIDALRDVRKVGALAPQLKPIIIDVIGRMA